MTAEVPLDLLRSINDTLDALRRDTVDSKQLQRQTLSVLHDIAKELEYLRTERRRIERIEAQLAELREHERVELTKVLDQAEEEISISRTQTGKRG